MLNILKKISNTFYITAKASYKHQLSLNDANQDNPPLLIYTMGKVGSTSITDSLSTLEHDYSIYHIHHLTDARLKQLESKRKVFFNSPRNRLIQKTWEAQYVADLLENNSYRNKWKVITLLRDPVARNISTFFQNTTISKLENGLFRAESYWYDFTIDFSLPDIGKLINCYFKYFHHEVPLKFFDDEIKATFDIDVFSHPFNKDLGYTILQNKTAKLLLIRLESLNNCATSALHNFMGIEDFKITKSNITIKKDYSNIYNLFKDTIEFPKSYLDTMYQSKFTRHFYTDEEISNLYGKWYQ